MTHGDAERVEFLVDAGAAMLLAGAIGCVATQLASGAGLGASVTALSLLGCFYGLRAIAPEQQTFALPDVSVPFHEPTADVLELSEADRWIPNCIEEQELLLDRQLSRLGPDSRVVRLFAPAAMPTAGELKARIDRHLVGSPETTPLDASQDLYDALAALRRSLR